MFNEIKQKIITANIKYIIHNEQCEHCRPTNDFRKIDTFTAGSHGSRMKQTLRIPF